jgi:hypothetical protein
MGKRIESKVSDFAANTFSKTAEDLFVKFNDANVAGNVDLLARYATPDLCTALKKQIKKKKRKAYKVIDFTKRAEVVQMRCFTSKCKKPPVPVPAPRPPPSPSLPTSTSDNLMNPCSPHPQAAELEYAQVTVKVCSRRLPLDFGADGKLLSELPVVDKESRSQVSVPSTSSLAWLFLSTKED